MPRSPRIVIPGYPMHIVQRGNNRNDIFYTFEDRKRFLEILKNAVTVNGCAVHAWVLMTNHIHLLTTPSSEDGPAKVFETLGRHYVQWFNRRHARTGTLWEGRFRSCIVDSDAWLLKCYRYIELNPVNAKIVSSPDEFKWTSYHANALGMDDGLTVPHSLFEQLGGSADARRRRYRAFIQQKSDADIEFIRQSTLQGYPLGDDCVVETVSARLDRDLSKKKRGGDRRSARYQERRSARRESFNG